MFILTRRLGETILIGDDIRVSLVDIQGSQVPVSIKAQREIDIKHEELLELDTEDA